MDKRESIVSGIKTYLLDTEYPPSMNSRRADEMGAGEVKISVSPAVTECARIRGTYSVILGTFC